MYAIKLNFKINYVEINNIMNPDIGSNIIRFGKKFNGNTYRESVKKDPGYFKYLLEQGNDFYYPEIKEYVQDCLRIPVDAYEFPECDCGEGILKTCKSGDNAGREYFVCRKNDLSKGSGCKGWDGVKDWFKWGMLPITEPIRKVKPKSKPTCGCKKDGLPLGLHVCGESDDIDTLKRLRMKYNDGEHGIYIEKRTDEEMEKIDEENLKYLRKN